MQRLYLIFERANKPLDKLENLSIFRETTIGDSSMAENRIVVLASDREHQLLKAACAKRGISMSAFIREKIEYIWIGTKETNAKAEEKLIAKQELSTPTPIATEGAEVKPAMPANNFFGKIKWR